MIKKNFYKSLLFFFLFLIIILRLWKVSQFFSFNFDEEYQASMAWEQIKNFHPIWIGVSASNLGFYLGPGFTYLNAFLFWISKGDPVSLAYFSAIFGIVTMLSLFFIVKSIFFKKAALISTIIYGASSLIIFLDRRFWNPTPIPFITIWLFFSLIKTKEDSRWFILTSALMAIALHVHLALIILWPVVFFSLIKNFKKIRLSTWFIAILIYCLIISPLIVFDFVHNFDNLKAPFKIFTRSEHPLTELSGGGIKNHVFVLLSSLGRIWFLNFKTTIQDEHCLGQHCLISPPNIYLIFFSLILFGSSIYKYRKKYSFQLILIMLSLIALSFSFYPGYAAEYYLLGFFILLTIIFGLTLKNLPNLLILFILSVFIFFNSYTIFSSNQDKYGLIVRKKLIIQLIKKVGKRSYSLEVYGKDPRKYHPYGGWRYLFKIYGKTPTQSFADEFFGWIFPDELSDLKPDLKVVITDDMKLKTKIKPMAEYQYGVYSGYIFPYEAKIN